VRGQKGKGGPYKEARNVGVEHQRPCTAMKEKMGNWGQEKTEKKKNELADFRGKKNYWETSAYELKGPTRISSPGANNEGDVIIHYVEGGKVKVKSG